MSRGYSDDVRKARYDKKHRLTLVRFTRKTDNNNNNIHTRACADHSLQQKDAILPLNMDTNLRIPRNDINIASMQIQIIT